MTVACALAVGCAASQTTVPSRVFEDSPRRSADVFGEDTQIVRGANRVIVFRIDAAATPSPVTDPDPNRILGYPIVGDARIANAELAARFQRALVDPANYDIDPPGVATIKLCGHFQPGVALRFLDSQERHFDVLFCFLCDDVGIKGWLYEAEDPEAAPVADLVTVDMSPGRRTFLSLFVEAHPNDEQLKTM